MLHTLSQVAATCALAGSAWHMTREAARAWISDRAFMGVLVVSWVAAPAAAVAVWL